MVTLSYVCFDLLFCLQIQRVWIEKTFQKRECVQIILSKDPSRYFLENYRITFSLLLFVSLCVLPLLPLLMK